MVETVLVTGGTGFIAGWCIASLLERGFAVRTTVRSAAKEAGVRAAVSAAGQDAGLVQFAVADLMDDAGWDAAVSGCDYVLHVASPLGFGEAPKDREALVGPARDGTLRVLKAATKAGVKRVVMTSAAATARAKLGVVSDETVWSDPADPRFDAYRVSKIRAEQAAWAFMAEQTGPTTLTTILPGAVFGPILSRGNLGSVQVIGGMLSGRMGGLPRLGFFIVDVRDLADLHVRAMTAPEAAGQRFLATGDFMWMGDIADTLKAGLGERAAKVPTRRLPDWLVRLLSIRMVPLRGLVKELGRKNLVTSAKAQRVLGFAPRSAKETVLDCAESLLAGAPARAV